MTRLVFTLNDSGSNFYLFAPLKRCRQREINCQRPYNVMFGTLKLRDIN